MYAVSVERMQILLPERERRLLRQVAKQSGRPVAELVREAIEAWLEAHGVREIDDDEWQQRFSALLEKGRGRARELGVSEEDVEADVAAATAEVKARRRASRS